MVDVGDSFLPPNGFKIQQMANELLFVSFRRWRKKAFYIAIYFLFKQEKLQTSLQSRLVIVRDVSRSPDTSHPGAFWDNICRKELHFKRGSVPGSVSALQQFDFIAFHMLSVGSNKEI